MLDSELPTSISIDVTPMATIALILVIIFVSSATTWMQPLPQVELPRASTAESDRKQNVTVSILADGSLAVDDRAITQEGLPEALKSKLSANRDKFVIVRADRIAAYKDILGVMAVAKSAGAASVTLATEQKTQDRP